MSCEASELVNYLESNDAEVVKHFKNIIQENLYTASDNNLLDTLVDQYVRTRSSRLIELLVGVSEPHSSHLFEKLNEHLKHNAHLEVCTLLFSIVRKQPSWLHKIVGTSLFSTFLKILKTDNNFILMMNGIMILCTLMPCVPAILVHGELLEVFVHAAALLLNKAGHIPEVCMLHLHVGVYIFFHRLYSMYPNNFLSYMRSHFAGKKNVVFQQVIKPMFEFVKFHPGLVTDTSKSEASLERWKLLQPHDIVAECQKLSLDPIDSIKEATYVGYVEGMEPSFPHAQQGDPGTSTFHSLNKVFTNPDSSGAHTPTREKRDGKVCNEKPSKLNERFPLCNPSEIIGNDTPPLSCPISPSNSAHDISSASTKLHQQQCAHGIEHSDIAIVNHELDDSTHTLNDSGIDRKSSGESLLLTASNRTGSVDNVHQKSLLLRSFRSSNNHSTPVDKDSSAHNAVSSRRSTPNSPRRPNGPKSNNNKANRPMSTEFFKSKLHFGHSGHHDIQSAPTSPMVHGPPGNNATQFSFNSNDINDDSDFPAENTKDLLESCSKLSSHNLSKHTNTENSDNDTSLNIINGVKEMFCEAMINTGDSLCEPADDSVSVSGYQQQTQQQKSPLTLLDDFIQYGCNLHSSILSRISLTSQLDTDWDHYDGSTSMDETKILQMQVHMLHIQLLYERDKSRLHCLRNRRLFASLQRTHARQNEVDSLKDQLALTESKLKEVKFTSKMKGEQIKQFKTGCKRMEKELNARICELEENNRILQYKLKSSEGMRLAEQDKNQALQKELHKVKSLLFEATKEIMNFQPKVKDMESLTAVVEILQKELTTQVQKQERMRNTVENFQVKNNNNLQLDAKLRAHRYELEEMKDKNDVLRSQLAEYKYKLHELEAIGVKREKLIREQKERLQNSQQKQKKEIQVYNDRFESLKKTSQSLQSYVMSLHSKFDGTTDVRRHSNVVSKSGEKHRNKSMTLAGLDIPNVVSSHSHHHDHSHRHAITTTTATMTTSTSTKTSDNPFRKHRLSHTESKEKNRTLDTTTTKAITRTTTSISSTTTTTTTTS